MDYPKNVMVYKDDKCYKCTLHELAVSGGKQVLYVAEDGTVLKKEPLFRYNERIRRRKGETGYAIKV
jgi:hypothetical protein